MSSAAKAQVVLQDRIRKSICGAEDVLISLAKMAEAEAKSDTEQLRSFTGEEESQEETLDGASTQKNYSSSSSSKKSAKNKKDKAKKINTKSKSKSRSSSRKGDDRVMISPPKEMEGGGAPVDGGIMVHFTLNLRNPHQEKKTIDFRLDCVDYKPVKARIDGQWKDVRPAKK